MTTVATTSAGERLLLPFEILPQPDDITCGPTCLHAVYRYFGDHVPLDEVIRSTPALEDGARLGATLGVHALERGYKATIYTFNLHIFDPTWFPGHHSSIPPKLRKLSKRAEERTDREQAALLSEKLRAQLAAKGDADPKLGIATQTYLRFLELGGRIRLRDLNAELLKKYLKKGLPILTGLSSTWLYRCEREWGPNDDPDDIRGHTMGHFVVLCGYDKKTKHVHVKDPLEDNPAFLSRTYEVEIDRLVQSILLGVLTYDANLLVIEPPHGAPLPAERPFASPGVML